MKGGRFVILAFLGLAMVILAPGKDGRDFAGFYEVSNVTDAGQDVRLTLSVRVFNYSDADVRGATITLEDSLLPGASYGSFPAVDIPDKQNVRLTKEFTVPRREHERWQSGGTPRMTIAYQNAAGQSIRRMIELAQMPLGREE